jgi:hypothetical protein
MNRREKLCGIFAAVDRNSDLSWYDCIKAKSLFNIGRAIFYLNSVMLVLRSVEQCVRRAVRRGSRVPSQHLR